MDENIKKKDDNVIYNIINNSKPNILFNYFMIVIFFIFIFKNIEEPSHATYLALILSFIIIYYIYTNIQISDVNEIVEKKDKFDLLNTTNSVLKFHTKLVNLLFYISDIKDDNIELFEELVKEIEFFCTTFDSCMIDFKLINSEYSKLVQLKINILVIINNLNNSLIFSPLLNDKIVRVREKLEEILNEYLAILYKNHQKQIYYNGYSNDIKIIENTNILPLNSIYTQDYKISNFNFSNLLFLK